MKKLATAALVLVLSLSASMAHADWHTGKLGNISIGYDGSTFTFTILGYTRTNCTCYATWNTNMCLNRSRLTYKEEVAMVYSLKARDKAIAINIDEASCSVIAMYEPE
jgi:hypothetical protein